MILWRCPNGCPAVRGPTRPRRRDVCRYCLACSAKVGSLVDRVAPVLERKREASEARRGQKKVAARVREKTALTAYPKGWIALWWERAGSLKAWSGVMNFPVDLGPLKVTARFYVTRPKRGSIAGCIFGFDVVDDAGREWKAGEKIGGESARWGDVWKTWPARKCTTGVARGRSMFRLTLGTDRADALATLLHELAHLATTPMDPGHGDLWRATFFEACRELVGVTPKLSGAGTKRDVHSAVVEAIRASGAEAVEDPRIWRST